MSDQPKYQATFSGQFTGSQVAMGEQNKLDQHVNQTVGGGLSQQELAALMSQLTGLRERVAVEVPADRREEALRQIGDIEAAAVAQEKPEPGRLARVHQWFLNNAPDIAEGVAVVLLGPLVARLVGGGAGAIAAALGAEDNPLRRMMRAQSGAQSDA
jgi:hypothetical protein